MIKRAITIVATMMFVAGVSGALYAMCGMCGTGEKHEVAAETQGKAVEVGNKICPVMGEKIDMNKKLTAEYNGKIYNLCCPACTAEFPKDPKKYSEIADKEIAAEKK
jgi:YHS domain-containing protein